MPKFSAEEKLDCAMRELKMRQRVYPNRVLTQRMTERQAKRELELMAEIRDDYLELSNRDRLL